MPGTLSERYQAIVGELCNNREEIWVRLKVNENEFLDEIDRSMAALIDETTETSSLDIPDKDPLKDLVRSIDWNYSYPPPIDYSKFDSVSNQHPTEVHVVFPQNPQTELLGQNPIPHAT